jgi:hypothetical protein
MKAATVPIRAVAMLVIRHRNVEKTICFISEPYNHPHTGLIIPVRLNFDLCPISAGD